MNVPLIEHRYRYVIRSAETGETVDEGEIVAATRTEARWLIKAALRRDCFTPVSAWPIQFTHTDGKPV